MCRGSTADSISGMTSYHHLARPAAWWSTVLGTFFVVAAGMIVSSAVFLPVTLAASAAGRPEVDGVASLGPLADLAMNFLMVAMFLPPVLFAARWIQGRPAGTLASVTGRLRLRLLLTCLGPAAVAVAVVGVALQLPGVDPAPGPDAAFAGWRPFLIAMLVLLAVVPAQAAAEEFVCRGWLLQGVGAWFRGPWIAIAVQALVFAALHGWGTPWGFADLLVFGVAMGWLTVRTGGLEAAIALHVANNLMSAGFAAAVGMLTIDETAADLPWAMAVIDMAMIGAYTAVVWWLTRRRERAAAPLIPLSGSPGRSPSESPLPVPALSSGTGR
jgi:membrane protease YdiL (CAAX protease family)